MERKENKTPNVPEKKSRKLSLAGIRKAAKKLLRGLLILAVILMAIWGADYIWRRIKYKDEETAGQETAVYTQSAQAERQTIVDTVFGSGNVQAARQPGAYAQTDGTITDLYVSLGDAVKTGDIVAKMENEALEEEIAQLEYSLLMAQKEVEAVKTYEQFILQKRLDEDGEPIISEETFDPIKDVIWNELVVEAPCDGRVMAIYVQPGDDTLSVYREKGAVAIISTDGRMKVELENVRVPLKIGEAVTVEAADFVADGTVVGLSRRGTECNIQILTDEYPVDTPVVVKKISREIIGEGTLHINKPMAVSAYGGKVWQVLVQVGDMVKRTDTLVRFDWETFPLYLENASALREYDKAMAELEDCRKRIASLTVTAPCDGRIGSVDVSVNDEVKDGAKLLSVVEDGTMGVMLTVDELDIIGVQPGQRVTVSVDAVDGLRLAGQVRKIAPLGNVNSGVTTYDVTIDLEIADERVLSGMSVTGEIEIARSENTVVVPTQALSRAPEGGWQVTLASGAAAKVETGIMNDDYTEILSGISAGETVIF